MRRDDLRVCARVCVRACKLCVLFVVNEFLSRRNASNLVTFSDIFDVGLWFCSLRYASLHMTLYVVVERDLFLLLNSILVALHCNISQFEV